MFVAVIIGVILLRIGMVRLHFGIDMLVMAGWSLVVYYIAVPVRLTKEKAQQYIIDSSSGELVLEPAE